MMNKYSVYLLQSLKDNGYYIGYTSKDPEVRLRQHNSGMVKSTKPRRPFKLLYYELFGSKSDAFKREWHLKHPAGYKDKLDLINKYLGL